MSETALYAREPEWQHLASPEDLVNSLRAGAHQELLPGGMKSEVYTSSPNAAASPRDDPDDQRERIQGMNTPENITANFFTKGELANGSTVHEVITTEDGVISFLQPTGGYAGIDVLGAAASDSFEANGLPERDGEKYPISWYDLPVETRRVYVASQLDLLQATHVDATAQGNEKAIVMQNNGAALGPVTSQSIGVPHFHATKHALKNFTPHGSHTAGMEVEEAIANDAELADRTLPKIEQSIREALEAAEINPDGLIVVQRHVAPYGFSIVFGGEMPLTVDNLTDPDSIAKILIAQETIHEQYAALEYDIAANDLPHRYGMPASERVTPQPSYQTLMDITDKDLVRLTYAPILASRGGPVEKCHVMLDRRNDPSLLSGDQETLDKAYRGYAERVGETTLAMVGVRIDA